MKKKIMLIAFTSLVFLGAIFAFTPTKVNADGGFECGKQDVVPPIICPE